MKTQKLSGQSLISSLWIFILFNMTFRDFHQFLNKGYIEEMMHSKVTQPELLLFALLLEIPIAMIVLSKFLGPVANQWTNTIAAIPMVLGMLSLLPEADMDDIFFTTMQLLALICIAIIAWRPNST